MGKKTSRNLSVKKGYDKHTKRYLLSLATREIQIKTMMAYHYTPKRETISNAGENAEKQDLVYHC